MRRYNKGWVQESARHSLAAQGVPTGRKQRNAEFMKEFGQKLKGIEASTKEKLLNDKEAVESYEFDGKIIQIFPEQDPETPRNWDNLGHIVAFHREYELGDKDQDVKSDQFAGWEELEEYLRKEKGAVVIAPLYLYDHSGLRIKIGSFQGLLPQGHAEFDSGQVGFIYVTKADLKKEKVSLKKAQKIVEGEVDTYDDYLSGNVYGYVVTDPKSGKSDSVWGYYGIKDVKEQAEESAKRFPK